MYVNKKGNDEVSYIFIFCCDTFVCVACGNLSSLYVYSGQAKPAGSAPQKTKSCHQ